MQTTTQRRALTVNSVTVRKNSFILALDRQAGREDDAQDYRGCSSALALFPASTSAKGSNVLLHGTGTGERVPDAGPRPLFKLRGQKA